MTDAGRSERAAANDVDEEVDVVVLGFGAAGCAAAIEAHDAGARVIVFEKMPAGSEGGNTRVSGGVWFDNRDPEGMAEYLRALCGDFPIPEPVVEVWAHETARNTEWMERAVGAKVASVGDVPPEYPELPGSDAYGGYVGVDGTMGSGKLFGVLSKAVHERSIEVRTGTPARELIATADGVTGVVVEAADGPVRIGARGGVVLATGGFENNPQMVRDYLGLPAPVVWGSPGSTGDGIRMAQKVGADLWHMDNMMTILGLRAAGTSAASTSPSSRPAASSTSVSTGAGSRTSFRSSGTARRTSTAVTALPTARHARGVRRAHPSGGAALTRR